MTLGTKFFLIYIGITVTLGITLHFMAPPNRENRFQEPRTKSGKPLRQAILDVNFEMFNAGCVYPLNELKRRDPKYFKGDPQSFCRPATEAARKQLMGVLK